MTNGVVLMRVIVVEVVRNGQSDPGGILKVQLKDLLVAWPWSIKEKSQERLYFSQSEQVQGSIYH